MADGSGFTTSLRAFWARLSRRPVPQRQGYDGYVHLLSERLYRETLGAGGWAVDAGLLGPAHYRADAQRLVHEIALGSGSGDVPSP